MTPDRKVVLYISMSLDGYIAKRGDDLSFLSIVEQAGQDYGYSDFLKTVDTVIIGRKSYDKVLSMGFVYPHTDKKVYIITRTERPDNGPFNYYGGSLKALITELKSKHGKNIYCDGGAEIANALLKDNLIDEFIISVIPVMLGDGVSLFNNGRPGINLKLVSSTKFEKGLVQLHYTRADN
jgi:dihydrofolate reductase